MVLLEELCGACDYRSSLDYRSKKATPLPAKSKKAAEMIIMSDRSITDEDCPSSHRDMIYHSNAARLLSL
jgi:hypothetical protein